MKNLRPGGEHGGVDDAVICVLVQAKLDPAASTRTVATRDSSIYLEYHRGVGGGSRGALEEVNAASRRNRGLFGQAVVMVAVSGASLLL